MVKQNKAVADLLSLITLDEAAALRGVSRAAISYLVARGRIQSKEMFGRVLVYREEVLSYKPAKGGRPAIKKGKGKSK
jgi:excisionase family DNA binding protein